MLNLQAGWRVMKNKTICLLLLAIIIQSACARVEQPIADASLIFDKPMPVVAKGEQEKRAFAIFEEILNVTQGRTGEDTFPKIELLYLELITTCPDTGLAQESIWRLFEKYFEHNTAESLIKARNIYNYSINHYPNSVFRELMARKLDSPAPPQKK